MSKHQCPSTTRMWRSQVYVQSTIDRFVLVRLPGWKNDDLFPVRLRDLPEEMRSAMQPGYRCYAQVNIGAEHRDDIRFADWEAPL